MEGNVSGFEWPNHFEPPAGPGAREIDGVAWSLRLSLNVLEKSVHNGRTITLPNLLRFFNRRWSDYVTAAGHEPPHGRSYARALLTAAYRDVGGCS